MRKEDIDMENARASIYGFLSALFIQNLSAEKLEYVLSDETAAHLKMFLPEGKLHEDIDRLVKEFSEEKLSAEEISLDFESLMKIPGPSYIFPYESSYQRGAVKGKRMNWERRIQGPAAIAVRRCYQEEGFCVRNESVDFPDHIGAELEFMAQLCRKAASAIQEGGSKPVGEIQASQAAFFHEHLSQWAGELSEEMRRSAETLFYRWLGDILTTFLDMEKRHFVSVS